MNRYKYVIKIYPDGRRARLTLTEENRIVKTEPLSRVKNTPLRKRVNNLRRRRKK